MKGKLIIKNAIVYFGEETVEAEIQIPDDDPSLLELIDKRIEEKVKAKDERGYYADLPDAPPQVITDCPPPPPPQFPKRHHAPAPDDELPAMCHWHETCELCKHECKGQRNVYFPCAKWEPRTHAPSADLERARKLFGDMWRHASTVKWNEVVALNDAFNAVLISMQKQLDEAVSRRRCAEADRNREQERREEAERKLASMFTEEEMRAAFVAGIDSKRLPGNQDYKTWLAARLKARKEAHGNSQPQ